MVYKWPYLQDIMPGKMFPGFDRVGVGDGKPHAFRPCGRFSSQQMWFPWCRGVISRNALAFLSVFYVFLFRVLEVSSPSAPVRRLAVSPNDSVTLTSRACLGPFRKRVNMSQLIGTGHIKSGHRGVSTYRDKTAAAQYSAPSVPLDVCAPPGEGTIYIVDGRSAPDMVFSLMPITQWVFRSARGP